MIQERKTRQTKSWEELTFADNFLFCKILEHDPDLCRRLLELLLHIKIDRLEPPQAERVMQETLVAKSVRFDVYAKDDQRVFDIERQTTDTKNLPKRARYYQSIIDMDNLSKGENYTKLRDSYVIFLCLEDIFRKGRPVYFFENTCRGDRRLKLDDRAYKVFFNAVACDTLKGDEERDFFRFLSGEKADSVFSKTIEEKVAFAKRNMEWRRQYMTWQQTIDEAKEISFEEGARQTARETARNFLREGDAPEKVARCCSLPLTEVLSLQAVLSREIGAR